MGLIETISPGPIAIDTAVFIYFIQAAPEWRPIVRPLFQAADTGKLEIVTSAITLLELLVVPYRTNDTGLADQYEALLTRSHRIRMIEITESQLRRAAYLRAHSRLQTPDALQLAAAHQTGCQAFITNDKRLPTVPGLRIIQLSELRDT
jgi:predicted nucleic acid-binding protein